MAEQSSRRQIAYSAAIAQRDRYREKADRLAHQLEQAEQREKALREALESLLKYVERRHGGDPSLTSEDYYIERDFARAALTTPESPPVEAEEGMSDGITSLKARAVAVGQTVIYFGEEWIVTSRDRHGVHAEREREGLEPERVTIPHNKRVFFPSEGADPGVR